MWFGKETASCDKAWPNKKLISNRLIFGESLNKYLPQGESLQSRSSYCSFKTQLAVKLRLSKGSVTNTSFLSSLTVDTDNVNWNDLSSKSVFFPLLAAEGTSVTWPKCLTSHQAA